MKRIKHTGARMPRVPPEVVAKALGGEWVSDRWSDIEKRACRPGQLRLTLRTADIIAMLAWRPVVMAAIEYDRASRKVAAHEEPLADATPQQRQRAIVDEFDAQCAIRNAVSAIPPRARPT